MTTYVRPTTTVKGATTDATLSGGAKRRADQSRVTRAKNRDYYIRSQRAKGEQEQLSAPRGVRLDSFCLRSKNHGEGPLDDDEAFSPSIFPKDGDLGGTASPAALSVRFLSRFRLSEGGTSSSEAHVMELDDMPNLQLPRLHSKATLMALRKRMAAEAEVQDGFFSFTNSALSSFEDDTCIPSYQRYSSIRAGAASNSVNLLALRACLDSIAETVTMPKSRQTKKSNNTTQLTSSWGLTRDEEEEEPLAYLLEDLDTTLQSLFIGKCDPVKARNGQQPPARSTTPPLNAGSHGLKSTVPIAIGSSDPAIISSVADVFGNFITTIDVYEAIYWQITETAATLLMSDTRTQQNMESTEKGSDNLLATVGQWIGLATVTCLHALDPKHFQDESPTPAEKTESTIHREEGTFSRRHLSSCLTGLFTLLLRFSVCDLSPITQLLSASAAPMALLQEEGFNATSMPSPYTSAYNRSLQEMSTEACGLLLSSPIFSQFVGLVKVVHSSEVEGTRSNSHNDNLGPFHRQDTESLGDLMIIESLFLKSFTEAARQRDRGVTVQRLTDFGSYRSQPPYQSNLQMNSQASPLASVLHNNVLLRDSQENAALLLCIVCASANAANADVVSALEMAPLLGEEVATSATCTKILVVSPRIASIAFSVFNEFISQATVDVRRARHLSQGENINSATNFPIESKEVVNSMSQQVLRYFDAYTGCYYYPPSSALPTPHDVDTSSGVGGDFRVDANVSLDSVMNALKGLGDLIGILYCLEAAIGSMSDNGSGNANISPTSYTPDSQNFGSQRFEMSDNRTASQEFSAATDRLQQIKDRADRLPSENGVSGILYQYNCLRAEVISRLTFPIGAGEGDGSQHGSTLLSSDTNLSGFDFFRPLLQKVPTIRSTGCISGSISSPTNAASPCSPLITLPLIGAEDQLATAFLLAEGVISFYSSDPRLARMIPSDVMQYFYTHHDVLFRVSETFSPYERSISHPREHDVATVTGEHLGSPSSPYVLSPPPALSSQFVADQARPTQGSPITPLLVRCRDALATLYCRAPPLVFQHWELFSNSILPFLSNHLDVFTRHHVLFILASLFVDPSYSEDVAVLVEQPVFQNAIGAVFEERSGAAISNNNINEVDEETDDVNIIFGPTSDFADHPRVDASAPPLTHVESSLLDIILSALMSGGAKDGCQAGGIEAALSLTDLHM